MLYKVKVEERLNGKLIKSYYEDVVSDEEPVKGIWNRGLSISEIVYHVVEVVKCSVVARRV